MIYYLQHIAIEGPGTLGDFFKEKGFLSKTIRLYDGDPFPEDFSSMECVVILGGPMNVYEEDRHPFLKQENIFIQKLIEKDILTVGLCLGAQLIAKAAGESVYKSPAAETGFCALSVTEQGRKDPLLEGWPDPVALFQWHEDTFDVPDEAALLLTGQDCRNQAFRIGSRVYGFQCHMEVTEGMALEWADRYISDGYAQGKEKRKISEEFFVYKERLCRVSEKTYNNLLKLIIAVQIVASVTSSHLVGED